MRNFLALYFFYTRSERNGVLLLIAFSLAILMFPKLYSTFRKPTEAINFTDFEKAIANLDRLKAADTEGVLLENGKQNISLFGFNPNTASLDKLTQLGLSQRIATTLIHYRERGGQPLHLIHASSSPLCHRPIHSVRTFTRRSVAEQLEAAERLRQLAIGHGKALAQHAPRRATEPDERVEDHRFLVGEAVIALARSTLELGYARADAAIVAQRTANDRAICADVVREEVVAVRTAAHLPDGEHTPQHAVDFHEALHEDVIRDE